jgi:hypothetical protein
MWCDCDFWGIDIGCGRCGGGSRSIIHPTMAIDKGLQRLFISILIPGRIPIEKMLDNSIHNIIL